MLAMIKVEKIIKSIEEEENVTVIFAVESGSRVWGMDSVDSDYDIRGLYISNDPLERGERYFNTKTLTIDGFTDDRLYDWVFWEVTSFLKLLQTNNSTAIDWIMSDICYRGTEELNIIKDRFLLNIDVNYYLRHHWGLMKSMYCKYVNPKRKTKEVLNDREILNQWKQLTSSVEQIETTDKSKLENLINRSVETLEYMRGLIRNKFTEEESLQDTKIKKILYACRSAISIEYIFQYNELPPLDINVGFDKIEVDFNKQELYDLIALKRQSKELDDLMCPEWLIEWVLKLDKMMLKRSREMDNLKISKESLVEYLLDCENKYVL